MKANLYGEYGKLISETNQLRNFAPRVKDLKKLRFMAIFKASEQPEATQHNLRVLSNQNFHKFVVEIVYTDAVLSSNRQRRESREFFERNIITQGINITSAPMLADNLVRSLTPEKISSYMKKITGFGTEKVVTRDIIAQTRIEREYKKTENRQEDMQVFLQRLMQKLEVGGLSESITENRKVANQLAENQSKDDQQRSWEQKHYLQKQFLIDYER